MKSELFHLRYEESLVCDYQRSTSKEHSRYGNIKEGWGAKYKNTGSTCVFSHTKSGPNTLPLITHSPPGYLKRTANYIVKCLQAFPVLRLLLSARQCVAEKHNTSNQTWWSNSEHWRLEASQVSFSSSYTVWLFFQHLSGTIVFSMIF